MLHSAIKIHKNMENIDGGMFQPTVCFAADEVFPQSEPGHAQYVDRTSSIMLLKLFLQLYNRDDAITND